MSDPQDWRLEFTDGVERLDVQLDPHNRVTFTANEMCDGRTELVYVASLAIDDVTRLITALTDMVEHAGTPVTSSSNTRDPWAVMS